MKRIKNKKTPFYVFDTEKLKDNHSQIECAFKSVYENFRVGYSFKTNTYSKVCKLVKKLGCYAEVVSDYEYKKAKRFGYKEKDIIYNGVCKDIKQVKSCLKKGGKVNADNLQEVYKFIENGITKFGLRVCFEIGNNVKSRFGVEYNSDDYREIVKLHKDGLITVEGLHCHFTNARDLCFWEERAKQMVMIAKEFGIKFIEYLDFGGNMYSDMPDEMKNKINRYIPNFEDYAKCLVEQIAKGWVKEDKLPELIIETGTPMVANAFSFVSCVLWLKETRSSKVAIMDCSQFDLGAISYVDNCPCRKLKEEKNEIKELVLLTGYTCMEDDVLKSDFEGSLRVGDKVVFDNCGAYSYIWSNDFIRPKAKVVTV